MFLLLRLSLRNLLRQKRRNLLLGSAMAIGVMLLVMASSFSHGLSDIMVNKVLRWMTGHVTVAFNERGRMMTELFRDKAILDFVRQEFKDVVVEQEEAIGAMTRAIGNGNAENLILVGTDMSAEMSEKTRKETEESFKLIQGKWQDLQDSRYENPVIISTEKAATLNVKQYDTLRLRLRNVFGQDQSARVTVVGTCKTNNIFMGPVLFGEMKDVKRILGFDEHSTGSVNLVIRNPELNARKLADAIHGHLKPKLAVLAGTAESGGRKQGATVLGFNSDPCLREQWEKQVDLVAGNFDQIRRDKNAMISQPLAQALGLGVGGTLVVRYNDKWGSPSATAVIHVGGILRPGKQWGPNVILLQDDRFYESFYSHWPEPAEKIRGAFVPGKDHPAYALLGQEWTLLPRTATTEELSKKMKDLGRRKWHSTVIDVRTMYETAEQILKLEGVINLITMAAVLVLFLIILIGVVNTLRMTIRERTREIGTIRAIGMQRGDVRNIFILETFLLAVFASIAGVLLAILAMWGLSAIPLHMEDNPMGMFLVNSRLYFIPTWGGVLGNMVLIWVLASVTAYFPARRAANLAPGAALRHFE